jgi:hypothetical protein
LPKSALRTGFMPTHIFDLFTKMISDIPPQAVLKALDLECRMLEQDEESHRTDLPEDASSIMSFRQFVRMIKEGEVMHCVRPLPPDHVELYKNTIVRLVHAGELPESAMNEFDFTFHSI